MDPLITVFPVPSSVGPISINSVSAKDWKRPLLLIVVGIRPIRPSTKDCVVLRTA